MMRARVPQQIPNSKTETFKSLKIMFEDSITVFFEKYQYTIGLQNFGWGFTVFDVAIKFFNAVFRVTSIIMRIFI